MSPEAIAASLAATPQSGQAGYGFSLTDLARFNDSMQRAQQAIGASGTGGVSPALESLMRPFERINIEAAELADKANAAAAAKAELTPGEMIMLTVRCQEFMFHCQLTSNIANRTSDGLQQLFRQQS
jgi:hypothetical protein